MNAPNAEDCPALTIVIPTYNNALQANATLNSIQQAVSLKEKCSVHVILVDNNSNAENREGYINLVNIFTDFISIEYILECRQGRSHACNTGALKCSSDWIAFIDDDETLNSAWLSSAFRLIDLHKYNYYGGPYLPKWESEPPPWLPIHYGQYRGVLGWIELSDIELQYDSFDGELCGGNILVERQLFSKVGGFSAALGRGSGNLLGGEDGEFHRRLKRSGAKGLYCPELSVQHSIPTSRMSINYHQSWAYWSGVSNRIRIITEPETNEKSPHLLSIPRYRFSMGLQGLGQFIYQTITGRLKKQPEGVIGLLNFMYLVGLLRGKAEGEKLGLSMKPSEDHR